MFKKRKIEDEWFIADEDFYDIPDEIKKTGANKSVSRNSKKNNSGIHIKQNPLRQRENVDSSYDSIEDYLIETQSPKKIARWKIVVPLLFLSIISLGLIGYFNTDFDNNGRAYMVPLELHYERKFIKQSDDLLNTILDINKSIDTDTAQLSNNYVNISSKLNDEMSTLKSKTTAFSKYVSVPSKFKSYHSQLITFSLSTQQFVEKLVKNYNDTDYESFRESGLSDYFSSLEKVKQARTDIDNIIFRNMEVKNELE